MTRRCPASPHNAAMPQHPDRSIALQGASNFRDLGGYAGLDGRPVRWRRIFRSDHLGEITPADQQRLAALGLTRTFDFRGENERAAAPCQLDGVTRHALTIEPSVVQRLQTLEAAGQALTAELVTGLMEDLYRGLVRQHAQRFASLFRHLLLDDPLHQGPLVFHCTAGKDRTGVAAALILLALGVPRDVVEADYLLTNQLYQRPALHASVLPEEVLAVLWKVQPRFLAAALQVIDGEAGGLDRYLAERLGVGPAERAALHSRYLEA